MVRFSLVTLSHCLVSELASPSTDEGPERVVIVIGATNRPDALDPAIRQAGRFAKEIAMGIPDEAARESILRVLSTKLRLAGDFDFRNIAHLTPGYRLYLCGRQY